MLLHVKDLSTDMRRGSRTATTSKMERFVIIVTGWKPFLGLLLDFFPCFCCRADLFVILGNLRYFYVFDS